MKKRVGILISGRGSNMMSLVAAANAADYPAKIVVVISNRPDAPGLMWAKDQGIPTIAIDHKAYSTRAEFEENMHEALIQHGAEMVACCGFLRLMTPDFVDIWRDRMLNIHPALLPSYKGLHTHERALADGVRIVGCTVHVVRAEMDVGPVIGQAAVGVVEGDTPETLAKRVLAAEHVLYPRALALFASGLARVDGEKIQIHDADTPVAPLFSPGI
ncbi:MAG: phosphoribosylglycinamide formyltransferase [Hyphomicrobiaceae bacterium]